MIEWAHPIDIHFGVGGMYFAHEMAIISHRISWGVITNIQPKYPLLWGRNDSDTYPDSKAHGANMGPTWVLSASDGPHVGSMNLAIRVPCHQSVAWRLRFPFGRCVWSLMAVYFNIRRCHLEWKQRRDDEIRINTQKSIDIAPITLHIH